MGILDTLTSTFKGIETFTYGAKAPKAAKHPRDSVLQLITNSLELIKDSSYKITKGKKRKTPEVCYKLDNGTATVKLTYSRENLKLANGDTGLKIDVERLPDLLGALHKAVAAGELDTQLEEIKRRRSESQKERKSKKAN